MKIKVYCDSGSWKKELKKYENAIEFIMFSFENPNKNVKKVFNPSYESWRALDKPWNECTWVWGEVAPSEKFNDIKKIIGGYNGMDIRHLDTAYKNKCSYFLTSDNDDIIKHKDQLEPLLGLKIFNSHKEFDLIDEAFRAHSL